MNPTGLTSGRRSGKASFRSRARTLVVGDPPGVASDALRETLELLSGSVEDAVDAVGGRDFDLLLLDGFLPPESLSRILDAAGGADADGTRPALVVVSEEGRRTNVESRFVGHVDDFINGTRGPEVVLARVGRALRTRLSLQELSRKNAELEGLYGRLEAMAGRMADELQLAAHLQRSLLPPAFQHSRVDVAREFLPFREIGGDYYDLVSLSPSRIAFALGDVMGKGVPAALLAANLKACLRAQLQAGDASPQDLVARVNRLFWDVTPKGLFASLAFAVLDLDRGRLHYVNAGHDYPFLVGSDGCVRDLVAGGTVLGLVEDSEYEVGQVDVTRGDLLVFHSDGVTDRSNGSGDAFGAARLREAAVRGRQDNARIALYSLLGEVQGWAQGVPPEDDMTLVVAKMI